MEGRSCKVDVTHHTCCSSRTVSLRYKAVCGERCCICSSRPVPRVRYRRFDTMQYAFEMMPLSLVVRLRGSVRGGAAVSSWHDALRRCCARGQRRTVVDCRDVEAVDASGLGAMVGALAIMRNAGGDLALAHVPDELRSLLLITRLTDVLLPYASVEAACRSIALFPPPFGGQPRTGYRF